jgi:hypothetical protein
METWIIIAGIAIVAILGFNLFQRFGSDRIAAFIEKRRKTSRMVGRGEFVDGNRHLEVALALDNDTFFYENGDMQASIDLQWVREIDYDTELATGTMPPAGRVLRLRSNSQAFEFVIPNDDVARWHMMLPPRRSSEASAAAVSLPPDLAPQVAPAT